MNKNINILYLALLFDFELNILFYNIFKKLYYCVLANGKIDYKINITKLC